MAWKPRHPPCAVNGQTHVVFVAVFLSDSVWGYHERSSYSKGLKMVRRKNGSLMLLWKPKPVLADFENKINRILRRLRGLKKSKFVDREKLSHLIRTGETLLQIASTARCRISENRMDCMGLIEEVIPFWISDIHSFLDEAAAVKT